LLERGVEPPHDDAALADPVAEPRHAVNAHPHVSGVLDFRPKYAGVTLLFKQDKHKEIGLKITKRVVEKLQEKRKEEKLEEDR
jgi:hypothetical protein